MDFTRLPDDKAVSVAKCDDGQICLGHEGATSLILSPFNAARMLAGLSMMLGLSLTGAAMKRFNRVIG